MCTSRAGCASRPTWRASCSGLRRRAPEAGDNGLVSNPYQPPSGQDPSGQQPFPTYGQPEAEPYGQPSDPYGQPRDAGGYPGAVARPYEGYAPRTGDHPQGTLILVLGIAGFLVAGVISPVAWILGSRAM